MNLKKTFFIELITGIVLLLLAAFLFTKIPLPWNSGSGSFVVLAVYVIINQILYRKQKECTEEAKLILKRAGIANGIFLGIPMVILLMNVKNPQPDYIRHFYRNLGFYVVIAVLFIHSLAGLVLLKFYERKK